MIKKKNIESSLSGVVSIKKSNLGFLGIIVKQLKTMQVLPILILMWICFAIMSKEFLTGSNMVTLLVGNSVMAVATIGQTLVLMTGGIDLSVATVISCSAIFSALAMNVYGGNILIGIIVALVIGLIVGLINGIAIGVFRMTPFIVTLATQLLARGLAFVKSQGLGVPGAPENLVALSSEGSFGIPTIVIIVVLLFVIFGLLLSQTTWGRYITMTGSNETSAKYVGINTKLIIASVYVVSGLLAGFAGFVSIIYLGCAIPGVGDPLLLLIVGSAILGGISMNGGSGNMLKAGLGVLIFATLFNGLNLINIPFSYQLIVQGIVIIIGMILSGSFEKKR